MTFDRQPTLVGPLLLLRPLRPEDWAALFAVASDPLIWAQHPDSDRYQEDVFRQFFADALNSGGALVAIEQATGPSSVVYELTKSAFTTRAAVTIEE